MNTTASTPTSELSTQITRTIPRMRVCRCCGIAKPITEFHRNSAFKDGYNRICKECANAASREKARVKRSAAVKTTVTVDLKEMSSQSLADELQRRGWKGEITKIDVITL